MLCSDFYKSRAGAEGFEALFPVFVPPTQNPKTVKVFPDSTLFTVCVNGETEFCLLNKHERRKCKAHRRLTLSLKKRSAVE